MKKKLKSFLQKNNLYYPLRYSFFFRIYQYLFKPGDIQNEKKETAFYTSFLPPSDLIFDIGAYDGYKTEAFLLLAKRVVSCEPDQLSFSVLKNRFRNKRKRVFLENKALSDIVSEQTFLIHHAGSAFNTLSNKWKETLEKDNMEKWNEKIKFSKQEIIQATTLDSLIEKYGRPGFIKIDVEGYEEHVLKGLSQPVPFLSFEGLFPDGYAELNNCLDRIDSLDDSATYNIAAHEKLLLPGFINRERLIDWLQKNPVMHLEIIAKMNVYPA